MKKFPSLKKELELLQEQLLKTPKLGILIAENTYKICLAVKSKGRGKSGGLRVITYLWEVAVKVETDEIKGETTIFLASIYDKSEVESISNKDMALLVKYILDSLKK